MWENGIYLGKGNSGRIETVETHGLRPQILQSYKSSFKQLWIALLLKKKWLLLYSGPEKWELFFMREKGRLICFFPSILVLWSHDIRSPIWNPISEYLGLWSSSSNPRNMTVLYSKDLAWILKLARVTEIPAYPWQRQKFPFFPAGICHNWNDLLSIPDFLEALY